MGFLKNHIELLSIIFVFFSIKIHQLFLFHEKLSL